MKKKSWTNGESGNSHSVAAGLSAAPETANSSHAHTRYAPPHLPHSPLAGAPPAPAREALHNQLEGAANIHSPGESWKISLDTESYKLYYVNYESSLNFSPVDRLCKVPIARYFWASLPRLR